jgi:CelD/BcsL family acetyltransferase involved in cellulose biosynthesis
VNAELLTKWKQLFSEDMGACALQHPDWVLAELGDEQAELLQDWNDDQLSALGILLPKTMYTRRFTGPGPSFRLQGMRLAGNRFLQLSDNRKQLARLVERALATVRRNRCDFLLVEDLDHCSSLSDVCSAMARNGWKVFAPGGYQARLRIEFPSTAEEYWQKFSGKSRRKFRARLRKFGQTRLEKITRPEEIPAFLSKAKQVSKQTWQTRQLGLRVDDGPKQLAQFTAAAQAGLLRSYLWFVEDEPVAFLVGYQSHGIFNCEEVGYATSFAKHSPGQMMLLQVIDDLFAEDRPHVFDFGGGDAPYKRLFGNSMSESRTVWLLRPGLRVFLVLAYVEAYAAMIARVRRLIANTTLGTRLRQRIRYGVAEADDTD